MYFNLKWLAWEITKRCNLNCIHCRSSSCANVSEHSNVNTQSAFKFLDDLTVFSSPTVVLSGGEPLLRKDVFEIAEYGTKKKLRMCLATNGTLVTEDICNKIKASGIKVVSLSLDGSCAQIHDQFRQQPGAFNGTLRAAKLFKEAGIEFIINSSFTKRNQHDIVNCFQLAKKIQAKAWYLFMVIPTGRGASLLEELIAPKDYKEILDWHYQMEKEEEDLLVRPTCAPHYYRIRYENNRANGEHVKSRPLTFSPGGNKGCLAGQSIAFIDAQGELFPCSYLPISAGNVFKQKIQDIWERSSLLNNFRDYSKYKGKCGSCEFIKICGGCRARSYYIKNDYLAAEPFCDYQSEKSKMLFGEN